MTPTSLPTPCGPVDDRVEPQRFERTQAVLTLMEPGWFPSDGLLTQAYGLCFTSSGDVVLVCPGRDRWTLPGGTIERGESPHEALVREVAEEACARVIAAKYLAAQHVAEARPQPDRPQVYFQTRWWARVELDEWDPRFEMINRRLVPPDELAEAISWTDTSILAILLQDALAVEEGYRRLEATPDASRG